LSEEEDVSLNTMVLNTLAKSVGMLSQTPIKEKEGLESDPIFAWPRISESAKRLLLQHGLGKEVQEINENMFAGWIAEHIHQAQASLEQKDNRTALRYIQKIGLSLEVFCNQSPLISSFCQMISILENQIINNVELLSGVAQQQKISQLITSQALRNIESQLDTEVEFSHESSSSVRNEIPEEYRKLFLKQDYPRKS
jgi:hypothetical protein